MKDCLVIAGEKSGEDHFMSFSESLMSSSNVKLWGVGGDRMQQKGVELVYHLNDFSSWGISGVIHKIPFYLKALKKIELMCEQRQTKFALLIDFQTFNLKLATRLKKKGVKVFYYVAPQAWAWKSYRAKILEQTVEILFTIIPFEKTWFYSRGVKKVLSVDHPILRQYKESLLEVKKTKKKPQRLLLLPGSRSFEVENLLPVFIKTARELQKEYNLEVSIVWSSSVNRSFLQPYENSIDFLYKDTELEDALKASDLALAASGTVTLTCALFQVPTCVAYKTSFFNEFIFYTFVNYKGFISLANICHEKEIFPEYTQEKVSTFNLKNALRKWLDDSEFYQTKIKELERTQNLIRGECDNVGQLLLEKITGES